MTNPFVEHQQTLAGNSHMSKMLRLLALHLYNECYHCRIETLLRQADDVHRQIAFDMMNYYAEYGKDCQDFIQVCQSIETL